MLVESRKIDCITPDQYAAIGRCVRSFSEFEAELGRAIISLHGGPKKIQSDPMLENHVHNQIAQPFALRVEAFISLCKKRADLSLDWIIEAEKAFLEGVKFRNAFAHGIWHHIDHNRVKLIYFSKATLLGKEPEKIWELTLEDFTEIDRSSLKNCAMLYNYFSHQNHETHR